MKFDERVEEIMESSLINEEDTSTPEEAFETAQELIDKDLDAIYNGNEADFEAWAKKYGDRDTLDDLLYLLLYIGVYKEENDEDYAPVIKDAIKGIPKIIKDSHGEYDIVNDKPIKELFKLLKKHKLTNTNLYKWKDDILK